MKRYLVTGGSGFIGSHLVEALLASEAVERIYVADLQPPKTNDPRVTFIRWDVRTEELVPIDGEIDLCFHLAALCKEPGYPWDEYFATNARGTEHLCRVLSALNVKRVVYTSTMMVFRAQERRMSESDLLAPDTAYGASKLLGEKALETWAAGDPRRMVKIVRPGVVFGRGENGNFTRLYYALKKGRFAYIGKKTTVKGCIYVKDVVRCLLFLAEARTAEHVFNLVLPENTTIERICDTFSRSLGLRRVWIPVIPLPVALFLGYLGEFAALVGVKTAVHHRRMEKLYFSTNISSDLLFSSGFTPSFDLATALVDWRTDCRTEDLF